jgi:diguanylate cyclase (GGDEF)-like protein/PAS domain S-box-containing protein
VRKPSISPAPGVELSIASGDDLAIVPSAPSAHVPGPRTEDLQVVVSPPPDALYRAAFEAAPLAMALLDADGCFFRVNEALCTLVGHHAEDLLGRPYESIAHPADGLGLAAGSTGYPVELTVTDERKLRHRDGHTVWARVSARTLRGSDPADRWTVCVWEDVDERRRTHERLAQLALHDPLTGVANRTLLDDRLVQALRARDRDGGVVAVLFCDVDEFKSVNDRFGHQFGDTLLEVVASRLSSAVRCGDTVARVGGDEFVVVSLVHDRADADAMLLRVGESLGDGIEMPGGSGLPLSVSVGMAIADDSVSTPAELLDLADRQMYAVKRRRILDRTR